MQLEVVNTNDGSTTLLNKELNATYHSKFGAVEESKHIYINHGLVPSMSYFGNSINIIEIGFGTGLNALLTLQEATLQKLNIHYYAIEKNPVPKELYKKLNYSSFVKTLEEDQFERIMASEWEEQITLNPFFKISKLQKDIHDLPTLPQAHLIYYDAFAPAAAPDMWQKPVFDKLYNVLPQKGSIITYCAKGEVKRTLKQTGFIVEALPGPSGKREITRAIKP
ncbi:MAG: tRNA (5-methylaminomethyl-2-thiouridine)(34)-methyltransferase MnmD [Bacteroidia bacterium]|nr:tRNA (5-methylaminomethyl-2-thiouridine)(34)-methyltransferase MnmD [Bacteroidia bacterium]